MAFDYTRYQLDDTRLKESLPVTIIRFCMTLLVACPLITHSARNSNAQTPDPVTLNEKADGYRGIWYMNQPSNDEYVYKYSGGLGTYCAKHKPFAIYCEQVDKTFFCYGGTTTDSNRKLLHMVSYFDHATKTVPRPTILLDKKTSDAHDNPVISVDDAGHIWIFSTSHGTSRPSYIHRSVKPYDVDKFELVPATRLDGEVRKPITNFSYMQAWHKPDTGFVNFFTRYGYPAKRTICFMNSRDGVSWSRWQRIAAIDEGHYQISGIGKSKAGSMFNYHPQGKGLNWRTNLYYVETQDNGESWHTVDGKSLSLPLTEVQNDALVHDYESARLNVYLKDVRFDENDRPVLLYITSKGYESGPKNDPRTWTIARWNGDEWLINPITTSDNNYDFGELWMLAADDWRVIGPTETGPQPYNPGGEVAMWTSRDQGATWNKTRQLTQNSLMNHTYVRRSLNAHPDFIAIWADGHGRQPSESRLHFSDNEGNVFQLPAAMNSDSASPILITEQETTADANQRHQPVAEHGKDHVRIALVGDSTVASYPNPPADRPDLTGWGQVLGEFFMEEVEVINHARSGRSSKSFIREGHWKKTLALQPDYVLIQFGHNDQPGKGDRTTDPEGDYREYLRQYITDAREQGIQPILVTPVARRRFVDGKVQTTLGPWAAAMLAVGKEHQVPIVDLHKASLQLLDDLCDDGSADLSPSTSDRTHFSRKGALAMARLVVRELRGIETQLGALIRE